MNSIDLSSIVGCTPYLLVTLVTLYNLPEACFPYWGQNGDNDGPCMMELICRLNDMYVSNA